MLHSDALLRQYGLRATPQRITVMQALTAVSHPDADQVYAYARERQASLSLATVYHVLDKFEDVGLISILEFHGRRYYDVRTEKHDHIRCRGCGRLTDVERDPKTILTQPDAQTWRILDQSLVWEGLCPACQRG